MRPTLTAVAVLLVLTGCHFNKRAQDAENAEEESTDTSKSSEAPKGGGDTPSPPADTEATSQNAMGSSGMTSARAEKATVVDESEKAAQPCSGMAIADLVASLSQASCELPASAPPAAKPITKDAVDVTVVPESTTIAPSGTATVRVVFKNKLKTPLPLDFTVDPDPRFFFQVYTSGGARVDKPGGAEPPVPSQSSTGETPETRTARVTLGPNGTATAVIPWHAVRYKWASKEKAKGALPGHGYPREPAGPLGRGKYVLVVVTPLANVEEGKGKELSHPRVNVEIAGNVAVEAPPAPPPKKAAPAAPAQPQDTDATIEAKFLKAAGASSPPPAPAKKP